MNWADIVALYVANVALTVVNDTANFLVWESEMRPTGVR